MARRYGVAALLAAVMLLPGLASAWETVDLSGSVMLPASALKASRTRLQVRLTDVSRPGAPAALLAEQIIEQPKASPVSYTLVVDDKALKPEGSYLLDAQLFVDGQLQQATVKGSPVSRGAVAPTLTVEPIGSGLPKP